MDSKYIQLIQMRNAGQLNWELGSICKLHGDIQILLFMRNTIQFYQEVCPTSDTCASRYW